MRDYAPGITLKEICDDMQIRLASPVIAALVNNELKELSHEVYNPKQIRFIDLSHPDGMRTYVRSLSFLLQVALKETFPQHKLRVQHSVSNGIYCEITDGTRTVDIDEIVAIEKRMNELVKADLPFIKKKLATSEAIELFRAEGYVEKALLHETKGKMYTSVYWLDGHADSFYGPLAHSTGALRRFGLSSYFQGVLLMLPEPNDGEKLRPYILQNKLLQVFHEHKERNEILEAESLGSLNMAIREGRLAKLIHINEALHEKNFAHIADRIADNRRIRIALIAGPSSSGKTTSAKRLEIQLRASKLNPHIIELDNYFVDREDTPRDEYGEYDFESLQAVDLNLFNSQMRALLDGKNVRLPKFDFTLGKRFFPPNNSMQLSTDDVLIIEGIHGLNPALITMVDDESVLRIYASALTSISLDENNRIPTTDNRLIRRIVRDAATRSYAAVDTIARWPSVRRGEDVNIFPFQENADIMFNSFLLYELCVLKRYAVPLLRSVPAGRPEYAEALRLLKFISYFEALDEEHERIIPPNSVLREFIGGSSFVY
jgi:uridine kinase